MCNIKVVFFFSFENETVRLILAVLCNGGRVTLGGRSKRFGKIQLLEQIIATSSKINGLVLEEHRRKLHGSGFRFEVRFLGSEGKGQTVPV